MFLGSCAGSGDSGTSVWGVLGTTESTRSQGLALRSHCFSLDWVFIDQTPTPT